MKRKSFLMTIVALLFAGVAFGQGITWPAGTYAIPNITDGIKGADTIYFCARTDSLYPIELGYDVAGKRLAPNYGNWSLISRTSDDVYAADYNLGVPNGNGGAGNAYKVVGSGIGGYLFQYEAADEQCGLEIGEKYWVYVFVLPDLTDAVSKDTFICRTATHTPANIIFANSFKSYIDLYSKADIQIKWKSSNGATPFSTTIYTDSTAIYSFADTLLVTSTPSGRGFDSYTCGLEGHFKLKVTVDSIGQLVPKSYAICPQDTAGDLGDREVNATYFHRNFPGTYSPATINGGTDGWSNVGMPTGTYWKKYTFSYTDCGTGGAKTVVDTLYLLPEDAHKGNWGSDTVTTCRTPGSSSIFDFYNDPEINYGFGKPGLTSTNSYWRDRGLKGKSWVPTDWYGTTDNGGHTPSLIDTTGYAINLDIMKSNMGYHYRWIVDGAAFPCLVDPVTGAPDTGYIVVILQDPAIALDFRANLCVSSYGPTDDFDVAKFTGITSGWDSPITAAGLLENVGALGNNTYKYKYELAAGCGAGGTGVFYLRVTNKIKSPTSKTVKYCVAKLPASINLNDVLGVSVQGLSWTKTGGSIAGALSGFSTDGLLDIGTYSAAHGSDAQTLIFTTTGEACGVPAGTTVTLVFSTVL